MRKFFDRYLFLVVLLLLWVASSVFALSNNRGVEYVDPNGPPTFTPTATATFPAGTFTPTATRTPTVTNTPTVPHVICDNYHASGSPTATFTPNVDARTYAVGVSQVMTGGLTDPVVVEIRNPAASGVTVSLVRCSLTSNVQNMTFSLARSGAPVTAGASATPVVYQISSYDSAVTTSVVATGFVNAQPTVPALRAFGYFFNGSSTSPYLIPYDVDARARRHSLKPGESFLIRIMGTSTSGYLFGSFVFSENP